MMITNTWWFDVVKFIAEYNRRCRRSPSQQEIADAFYTTQTNISCVIMKLERYGYIRRGHGKRNIIVIRVPNEQDYKRATVRYCRDCGKELTPETQAYTSSRGKRIPRNWCVQCRRDYQARRYYEEKREAA